PVREQHLEVAPGLVALDVGQSHADQDAADVGVLELDGRLLPAGQQRQKRASVLGLAVGLAVQLLAEHVEVVGDGAFHLRSRPVLAGSVLLVGLFAGVHGDAPQSPRDAVRVTRPRGRGTKPTGVSLSAGAMSAIALSPATSEDRRRPWSSL